MKIRDYKNIAVIQTAFLGDVALSLYLAQTIKKINPDCRLTFVTTPASASFVSCVPVIDSVVTYDKRGMQSGWNGIKKIAEILKDRKTDCIIAPHRSFRTSLLTFLTKADYSVSFDKSAMSFLYSKRIKYKLGLHEVFRNNSLLSAFSDIGDFRDIIPEVIINIAEDDKNYVENILSSQGLSSYENLIAIAPGSVWETKKWNKEYFRELSNKLVENGFKIVIIGGQSDIELGNYLSSEGSAKSLCGQTTLPQLIFLLSLCKLTITNDSSPTHFAGLAKCPTLTIYGATVPEFGFSPRGKFDRSIGIDGLKCRPCEIHGGRKCPIKTFDCMNKLTPDIILKNALEILELSRNI